VHGLLSSSGQRRGRTLHTAVARVVVRPTVSAPSSHEALVVRQRHAYAHVRESPAALGAGEVTRALHRQTRSPPARGSANAAAVAGGFTEEGPGSVRDSGKPPSRAPLRPRRFWSVAALPLTSHSMNRIESNGRPSGVIIRAAEVGRSRLTSAWREGESLVKVLERSTLRPRVRSTYRCTNEPEW